MTAPTAPRAPTAPGAAGAAGAGATVVRLLLGAAGVAGMVFGAVLLLDRPHVLGHVVAWFAVPVLLHDALLAPLGIALGWLGVRLLPSPARAPVVAGLLATAGLTLLVLPELLRPEPRPVTLLDRDYVLGYVVALALVWAAVLTAVVVRAVRRRRRVAPEATTVPRPRSTGRSRTGTPGVSRPE